MYTDIFTLVISANLGQLHHGRLGPYQLCCDVSAHLSKHRALIIKSFKMLVCCTHTLHILVR